MKENGVWAILSCIYFSPKFIEDFSTFTKGFFMSISANITALSAESKILPSSLMIMHSTSRRQTNLPVRMHRDSGSKALLPMIIFSRSLVISLEFFLFLSEVWGHAAQFPQLVFRAWEQWSRLRFWRVLEFSPAHRVETLKMKCRVPNLSMKEIEILRAWKQSRPSSRMLCLMREIRN